MTDLVKPIQRRVTVKKIAHGYRNRLVVTLHPNAMLEIREARTREDPVLLDLASLYVSARIKAAMATTKGRRKR
jgi:hypothetical protein